MEQQYNPGSPEPAAQPQSVPQAYSAPTQNAPAQHDQPPVVFLSPEEQQRREQAKYVSTVRRRTNKVTAFVFIYIAILSMAVMIGGIGAAVYTLLKDPSLLHLGVEELTEVIVNCLTSNGVGYLIGLPAIYLMVFLWKKKAFFKNVLYAPRKKIKPGLLLFLISLLFIAQAASDLFSKGLDWLLHFAGASATSALEEMQGTTSITMLLYICIGAPFIEEVFFRGAVMRSFQNFGRRFAIIGAAVLFALMHGNLVQIPFAFLAGLILGYAAMEYGIWWSILLHFFNNAIVAEGLGWLLGKLPESTAVLVSNLLIYGIAVVGVVLCIVLRKRIAAYLRSEKIRKGTFKGYFTSPVLIVMIGYAAVNSVALILMSVLA